MNAVLDAGIRHTRNLHGASAAPWPASRLIAAPSLRTPTGAGHGALVEELLLGGGGRDCFLRHHLATFLAVLREAAPGEVEPALAAEVRGGVGHGGGIRGRSETGRGAGAGAGAGAGPGLRKEGDGEGSGEAGARWGCALRAGGMVAWGVACGTHIPRCARMRACDFMDLITLKPVRDARAHRRPSCGRSWGGWWAGSLMGWRYVPQQPV